MEASNPPNSFIVGAPKCGTTAWVEYLSSHPEIFFSSWKEPHYFCDDFPGFQWIKTEHEYLALFADAGKESIIAEASVQYLFSKTAAQRIYDFDEDARILVFLRPQRSFLPSYHNQLLYNQDEVIPDFETAWRRTVQGKRRRVPATCRVPEFLDYPAVGRFDEQLQRYANLFPASQLLIMDFDDWTKDIRRSYLRVLKFLGLEDDGRAYFKPVHRAKRHRFDSFARLTQRPPNWALASARLLRRVTGKKRLSFARTLRRANTAEGYNSSVSDEVKAEIDAHFCESNIRLRELIKAIGSGANQV